MCRKKGKMPGETKSEKYEKEYGFDEIEIQENSITKDDVILIHDDLLATGGSMKAAYNLVQKFSPKDVFMNFKRMSGRKKSTSKQYRHTKFDRNLI